MIEFFTLSSDYTVSDEVVTDEETTPQNDYITFKSSAGGQLVRADLHINYVKLCFTVFVAVFLAVLMSRLFLGRDN